MYLIPFPDCIFPKDNDLLFVDAHPSAKYTGSKTYGCLSYGIDVFGGCYRAGGSCILDSDGYYTGWNCGRHSFDPAHFDYCAYFMVCTGMVCGEDKPEIKEQKLHYSVAFFGVFRTLLFGLFQGAGINSGSFAKCFDLWR